MNNQTFYIIRQRFAQVFVTGQTFLLFIVFFLFIANAAMAQAVIFDEFPITAQIYQRDKLNRGLVTIKGRLYTEGYTDVSILVKKDQKNFYWKKQKLAFQSGELLNAPFSFQPFITAGLVEYDIYLYAFRGADSVLVKEATQVLCGDNIVIYGQSNAEANDSNELAKFKDEFKYGRTTFANFQTNDYSWFPTMKWNYYMSGLVGLEIQRQLIDKYKVPIGIINGAVGNKSIDDLMKRDEKNHENLDFYYGQLVKKANKVGLSKTAKIFIWRQGESEAFDSTRIDAYPAKFDQLRKQILEDFPAIEKIYVYQNNIYWVENKKAGDLREFQRKLSQLYPDCESISTVGTPGFDGVHYNIQGYQANGLEVSRLIAKNFYLSADTLGIHTPNITKAYFNARRDSLTLEFDKNQQMKYPDYSINKNFGGLAFIKDYFYLDGLAGQVSGGKAEGNKIILFLKAPSDAKKITYCPDYFNLSSESTEGIPYLTNTRGMRAFTFKNFAITSRIKINKPVLTAKLGSGLVKRVTLDWTLQTSLTYAVEKSVGTPDNFTKVVTLTQNQFVDTKLKKGVKYYYRINVEDEVYSNIVEVTIPLETLGLETDAELLVYPNPVQQGAELKINLNGLASELVLTNTQGTIIERIQFKDKSASIQTQKLNPGVYFLEAIHQDNSKWIKKVIVN